MRTLRAVFVVHGLITLAGAAVLIAFPTAIPSTVGITIGRSDYLLVYLVAAAELTVAVLSFGATRITDVAALRLIVSTFVVLHLASWILTDPDNLDDEQKIETLGDVGGGLGQVGAQADRLGLQLGLDLLELGVGPGFLARTHRQIGGVNGHVRPRS